MPRRGLLGSLGHVPPQPPLAAVTAAALARKAGHDVIVLDWHLDGDACLSTLRSVGSDAVAIPASSLGWPSVCALVRALREMLPSLPVLVFGPHPTLWPEHALSEPGVSAAVVGDAEEGVVLLAERLAAGESPQGLPGAVWRGDRGIVVEEVRLPQASLDNAPLPAWDLVELSRYALPASRLRRRPALPMQLSRGCSHAECLHCPSTFASAQRYRRTSPEAAVEKVLAHAERFGVREVCFVDEDFVVGREWVLDFAGALRTRGSPVRWSCEVRPSQVDEQLLAAMQEAGCHQVLIGMDVLDTPLLRRLEKDQTVASCAAAARAARRAQLSAVGLFVVGLPWTDPAVVEATVEHALCHKLDGAFFVLYRPAPGTLGWEELGWGPADYVDSLQDPSRACFVPAGFADLEHVERVFRRALRSYHRDPRFLRRLARRSALDPVLGWNMVRNAVWSDAAPYWSYTRQGLGS